MEHAIDFAFSEEVAQEILGDSDTTDLEAASLHATTTVMPFVVGTFF